MTLVHLSTEPFPSSQANSDSEYYFNAGNLTEILTEEIGAENIDEVKKISYQEEMLEENVGKDDDGNSLFFTSIGKQLAKKMWSTYETYMKAPPKKIVFYFEDAFEYGLVVRYVIREIIRAVRGRYKATGLDKIDYDPITKVIVDLLPDLNEEEDEEEEAQDNDMIPEDEDLDDEEVDLTDEIDENIDQVDRDREVEALHLPTRFFEPVVDSKAYKQYFNQKQSLSKTKHTKIDSVTPSYRVYDQGKIFLSDMETKHLYFIKKPQSRGSATVFTKTFSVNPPE